MEEVLRSWSSITDAGQREALLLFIPAMLAVLPFYSAFSIYLPRRRPTEVVDRRDILTLALWAYLLGFAAPYLYNSIFNMSDVINLIVPTVLVGLMLVALPLRAMLLYRCGILQSLPFAPLSLLALLAASVIFAIGAGLLTE